MAVDVRSEIAGTVWQVLVQPGEAVLEGADLVVLESMKMEVPVSAPCDGVVVELLVQPNQPVEENEVLVRLSTS